MGGAIIGSMSYLGELMVGNLAFLFAEFDISWRWSFVAVAAGLACLGIAGCLLITEPAAGRFVTGKKVRTLQLCASRLWKALLAHHIGALCIVLCHWHAENFTSKDALLM